MRITRHKVIGWLCFSRYALELEGATIDMPNIVVDFALEKGWLEGCSPSTCGEDPENERAVHLTTKGCTVTDLHAVEWGIELQALNGK